MAEDQPSFFKRLTRLFTKAEVPEPEYQDPTLTTETSKAYYVEWLESFGIDPSRAASYQDYLMMDRESPIISAALDAIADAAVSSSEGEAEDVYTIAFPDESNEDAAKIFDELEQRTSIKSDTWSVIRTMSLLGDEFSELVIDPSEMQITEIKGLPPESMIVVPDDMGRFREDEYAYRQHNEHGNVVAEFKPWQIVHYGHKVRRTDTYGRSHLASLRRVYRQLQFIEDAMVINRLLRATMRYVHTVPVGGMSPAEAKKYVDKYKAEFIRARRFDPKTGKLSLHRNPLDEERDFFVPVGKEATGGVTAIQGQQSLDKIADVEFFMKKLFAALRVPPAYLGFESDTHAKSVITTLDVAFGRVVRRAQVAHSIGQRQVYQTELVLKKKPVKDINFQLVYNPVGTVDEVRRWQIELLKAQVAGMLKTQQIVMDDEYLLKKILQVEEEDYKKIMAANKKAKLEQQKEQEKLLQAQSGQADQNAKHSKEMATHQAALDVASHDVKSKIDKEREVKESRKRVSPRISQAVEILLQRRNVRQDLYEVYQLSQPMTATVNGAGFSSARVKELQKAAGL